MLFYPGGSDKRLVGIKLLVQTRDHLVDSWWYRQETRNGAVTGRRWPHSGVGQDFLLHRRAPLTKTTITRKQKSKK